MINKSKQKPRQHNSIGKKSTPNPSPNRKKFDPSKYRKITDMLPKKTENRECLKPLDVIINKPSCSSQEEPKKEKKKKSSETLKRNSSFDTYGINLPSIEEMKANQKKYDEHKEKVKLLDIFDDKFLESSLLDNNFETENSTEVLLDCKHLSLEELDEAFQTHVNTLSDIKSGKKHSERHNIFNNRITFSKSRVLQCSSSTVVFTDDQREHLLDLLSLEFDPENKLTRYFFQVLLPELCLLIFMDEHNLSKRKAIAYLDKRPLDF